MKKALLFAFTLGMVGAQAQSVVSTESRTDYGRNVQLMQSEGNPAIPYATNANKSQAATMIGTAPNVYGAGFGPRTNVWADEELNTIAFIHRSDAGSNGDAGSGSLRFDYSTDGGATWTNNNGPVYNPTNSYVYPGPGRYPNAAILNQSGNTNPLNAHLGVFASTLAGTNDSWGGAAFGNHKLDNTYTDILVDTANGHVIADNVYADGGTMWGISLNRTDYLNQDYQDTISIFKGEIDWTSDVMTTTITKAYLPIEAAPVEFSTGWDTTKLIGDARIFMADDGLNGYIAILGHNQSIGEGYVFHPYMIKTTDGGATWSAPFGPNLNDLVDAATGDSLIDLFDIITGGTWTLGNIAMTSSGSFDLAVDANGNPHIMGNVFPGQGTDPDGTSPAGNFTFYPGVNLMVDIYTLDGGLTWKMQTISQIFAYDYDFDAVNGPVTEANRPHLSMNSDRTKLFYSWFETDTAFQINAGDNNFPDWRVRGYDVLGDSLEGGVTVMGTIGDATWGNVADWAFDNGDGTHQLHMTYAPIADFTTFSVLSPIDFYYLGQPYPNNIGLEEQVAAFGISQNFPNPASELTRINIESNVNAHFNMRIFDLTGRTMEVRDLGNLDAGTHGISVDVRNYASGIYFYTIKGNGHQVTKKLIVE